MASSQKGKSPIKRSGTRRLGDGYQDVVALDVLIEWLEHPDRYQWVKVEADDAGSLDDVVALQHDGTLVFRQVKYATAPESEDDRLSWDLLLEQPTGKSGPKQSLLEKWSTSLKSLAVGGLPTETSLVTNRRPDPEFTRYLAPDGRVELARVDSVRRAAILQQFGSASDARYFFEHFRFCSDQMSLETWEDALWRRFSRCGGTEHGWANLNQELRRWVCYRGVPRPDGTITLADVKQAALWYRLQSLPQEFEVPADYVLPSEAFHQEVVRRLTTTGAACTVIHGSPGAGKSTYVSKLYHELTERGVPVVRHHYFLSLSDPDSSTRLDHLRAIESLMHDLRRNHADALGQGQDRNSGPQGDTLRTWLEACGQHYQRKEANQPLVVIIDGLDHVWREHRSVDELNRLLRLVLPVPAGVHLVLATQRVDEGLLPPALIRAAPTDGWLELPLLDLPATADWLGHHLTEIETNIRLDDEDGRLRLATALFRRSGGHPLHLRYTLRTAQERGLRLTEQTIAALPDCQHDDIVGYYRSLWQVLPEQSRQILHLLAATRFPWPRDGVHGCLDPDGRNVAVVADALKQVNHLLTTDALGLRPFHGSLLVFVGQQPDHQTFANPLRRLALGWLSTRAPEYWQWAYGWLLAAESGDPGPLIDGPDRAWTVDAITARRPRQDVRAILSRAIQLALDQNCLPRAIRLSLLLGYAEETYEGYHEAPPNLLFTRLRTATDPHSRAVLRAHLTDLTDSDVELLAEAESAAGNAPAVRLCFDMLRQRLRHGGRGRRWSDSDPIAGAMPLLSVAALPGGPRTAEIAGVAAANRQNGLSVSIICWYAGQLRVRKRIDGLRELLTWRGGADDTETSANGLTTEEKREVIPQLLLLALEEGIDADDVAQAFPDESVALIYAAIRHTTLTPGALLFPDTGTLDARRLRLGQRRQNAAVVFHRAFHGLLAGRLMGHPEWNATWLQRTGGNGWQHRFLTHLDRVAGVVADHLRAGRAGGFGALHAELAQYPRPKFRGNENWEEVDYGYAAARAALTIGLEVLVLFQAAGCGKEVGRGELQAAFASGYCHSDLWMDAYLAGRRTWLSAEAVDWLIADTCRDLETSLGQFHERAARYARLAAVAALHDRPEAAAELARRAADNLLAHGHHKDMVFDHVLDVVLAFHRSAATRTVTAEQNPRAWLLRLTQAITAIEEYTDGDDTGHLPRELASALAEVAPELLPAYCSWLAEKEEYYDTIHAFDVFVETADLSDPIAQAIARTATDPRALRTLAERAAADEHARAALAVLTGHLGSAILDRDDPDAGTTRTDSQPSGSSSTEDGLLPEGHPPERFHEFIERLGPYSMYRETPRVVRWMEHWKSAGRAKDALEAVTATLDRGHGFDAYDFLYEYAATVLGRDRAYPWLERANVRDWGWSIYTTKKERALARWEAVRTYYPTRWYQFLTNTVINEWGLHRGPYIEHGSYVRLIDYLLFMGQADLAREVIGEMVTGALELVSPVTLPVPEWATEGGTADGQ